MIILLLRYRFEKMKIVVLILSLFFFTFMLQAQSENQLMSENDSILMLSNNVLTATSDTARIKANDQFFRYFTEKLNVHHSARFLPDSLKMVSSLIPSDSTFRIHSWTMPLNNGTYRYFGVIELFKSGEYKQIILLQKTSQPLNDAMTYRAENWYGALYTSLIVTDWNKSKTYTLLGWDGKDARSNRKVVDILNINADGKISFGQPVFKTPEGIKQRYIMDYAQNATVTLKYDYQTIMMPKGKKRIKKIKDWMLVMDELAPLDPRMEGMKDYYVPTGTSYNAFSWLNGYWTFVENIRIGE